MGIITAGLLQTRCPSCHPTVSNCWRETKTSIS